MKHPKVYMAKRNSLFCQPDVNQTTGLRWETLPREPSLSLSSTENNFFFFQLTYYLFKRNPGEGSPCNIASLRLLLRQLICESLCNFKWEPWLSNTRTGHSLPASVSLSALLSLLSPALSTPFWFYHCHQYAKRVSACLSVSSVGFRYVFESRWEAPRIPFSWCGISVRTSL